MVEALSPGFAQALNDLILAHCHDLRVKNPTLLEMPTGSLIPAITTPRRSPRDTSEKSFENKFSGTPPLSPRIPSEPRSEPCDLPENSGTLMESTQVKEISRKSPTVSTEFGMSRKSTTVSMDRWNTFNFLSERSDGKDKPPKHMGLLWTFNKQDANLALKPLELENDLKSLSLWRRRELFMRNDGSSLCIFHHGDGDTAKPSLCLPSVIENGALQIQALPRVTLDKSDTSVLAEVCQDMRDYDSTRNRKSENDQDYMTQIPHELCLVSISFSTDQALIVGARTEPELSIFIQSLNESVAPPPRRSRNSSIVRRTIRRSSVRGEAIFGIRHSGSVISQAGWQRGLHDIVHHPAFEASFACLIILNSFTVAIEAQYQGVQLAHKLLYPGASAVDDGWIAVMNVVDVLEFSFGVLFTLEVVLKLLAERLNFFKSSWNYFDTAIVATWILGELVRVTIALNPMILRLCRLARIAKLVRLLRSFEACDSLHVLVNSVQSSLIVLVWSVTLLTVMITLVGLVTQHLAAPFLNDETVPIDQRHAVFEYFGSFTRSALSFFEATLGNFGPIMRILSENVDEWWGLYFILYKCIGGFAIVSVITGVILHETFGVAQSDPDLMVAKIRRQKRLQAKRMNMLFKAADITGSGSLGMEEFKSVVNDPFIQNWLDAMEFHITDAEMLFRLLDDGDRQLTADELLNGVNRLKGAARSMDLHSMMTDVQELKEQCDRIEKSLTSMS